MFFFYLIPFPLQIFAQDSSSDLQLRIYELESLVSILQAKLVEVDEYKFLLYAIVGIILFLVILGSNVSFKRKISLGLTSIKKQLVEKYRESISILSAETDESVKNEIKKIQIYNRKIVELTIGRKSDYPETYHKLACISAVEDNLDGVLSNLRTYFELSFRGVEVYVKRDTLFEKIIENRQFRELLTEFKKPGLK